MRATGAVLALIMPAVQAQDAAPQTTPEGMELVNQTASRVVYAMPGATLDPYTRIMLIDCYVAFEKDWQRDFNRDVRELDRRIGSRDMERITTALADEFRSVFSDELTQAGHAVVDEPGEDVLVIRPAIVNLDVTAPDVADDPFSRTVIQSAGEMTLFLELYDSTTNAIIARVIDAQASDRGGVAFEANRVNNRAEADRIIRAWARELEGHLGDVRQTTSRVE